MDTQPADTAIPPARWIDLDGAVNVRDVAGLPTGDGREVQPGRLIRSDNLQDLSDRDIELLVAELGLRSVADLRTGVEVTSEGPGPLHAVDEVEVRHLSLFPEAGDNTDVAAEDVDAVDSAAPVVLPWHERSASLSEDGEGRREGAAGIYLGYLDARADSVLDALRLIAYSPGATIVHCAAGKDRTGTVVALALSEIGVTREAIVTDYLRTAERIEAILARLRSTPTYAEDIGDDAERHSPRAVTMQRLLDTIDAESGGVGAWLRSHGWTEGDAAALRRKLLD